jgi:AcrR family transcriptional regulator
MPVKRSRPKTEQKFQDAVLELVAKSGCSSLGINAVAQIAGADKVLIYRYFGDFDGLLKTVAESRNWTPNSDDILSALPSGQPTTMFVFRSIQQKMNTYFRSDPCLLQLLRWRRADNSPLGQKLNEDWFSLWKTIPQALSRKLDSTQRQRWSQACSLLALVIEAELCGERIDLSSLEQLAEQLEATEIKQNQEPSVVEVETLPTNLL